MIDFAKIPDPLLRFDMATGHFVLIEDYVTPEITVPKGQYTDGATMPQLACLLVKQYDRHLPACIVHDYMYRQAYKSKEYADLVFHTNLLRCGVEVTTAKMMLNAVHHFGKGNY